MCGVALNNEYLSVFGGEIFCNLFVIICNRAIISLLLISLTLTGCSGNGASVPVTTVAGGAKIVSGGIASYAASSSKAPRFSVSVISGYYESKQPVESELDLLDYKWANSDLIRTMIMTYDVDELFRFKEDRFGDIVLEEYLQKGNDNITEIEVPEFINNKQVFTIAERAFQDAVYLRSIILPKNIFSLGVAAFSRCISLEEIKLPDRLPEISGYAFYQCEALKTIVLPKNIHEISFSAFENCLNLEKVVFTNKKSVRIEEGAFKNCSKLPPEFQIYSIVGYNNINRPFRKDVFGDFDWELALEEDVFKVAIKYNNFSVLKEDLFRHIIDLNKFNYLIQAEHLFDSDLIIKTLNYSIEHGNIEITAYLLDLKNRKFNFGITGDFDL